MSYTVLARRYRSSTFDEVVGQDHIAKTLKKAIDSGRIAHAYLFCGTRGVGKTSMARIMAKALNCEKADKPTTQPCGKCNSCQAIARGEDIDVIEIDAASNTGVENVRDLISNAQYRPTRARFKVYIIDEVHMLSKQAFNALLKTMEEPPEHVKFILATTEVEKVLPTILSRCQRYDFRNIPTREIAGHLKAICKDEKVKADEDALLLVAKAGAGSMRDSLSLLDRLLSVGEKQLDVELIEQTLGMPRSQVIFDLAQSIGEADVKAVLEGTDKIITGGLSADTLVGSLADHFRNLLILRTCGPKSDLVEVPGIAVEELNEQAGKFDAMTLAQDIAILEELRRGLRSSQAARAMLDATLVRLTLAEQFASVDELLGRVNGGGAASGGVAGQKKKFEVAAAAGAEVSESISVSTSSPVVDDDDDALPAPGKVWDSTGPSLSELLKQQESAEASHAAAKPQDDSSNIEPVDLSDLGAVWDRWMHALGHKSAALPGLLQGARLVGIENGQAIVQFPGDHASMAKMLERNGKKDVIRDILCEVINQKIRLKIELVDSPPEAEPAPPVKDRPQRAPARPAPIPAPAPEPSVRLTEELKQQLMEDEFVKAVVEKLGGEIVKVE